MARPAHAPWMKFYPADWRADPALRTCSLAARGLWLEMLAVMHEAEPYGHLLINGKKPTWGTIGTLAGAPSQSVQAAVTELRDAGVFSLTDDGVIFSRRMVRDHEKANRDKANGAKGGNPGIARGLTPRLTQPPPDGVNPEVKAQKPETRSQNKSSLRSDSPRPKAKPKIRIEAEAVLSDVGRAYATQQGVVNGSLDALWGSFKDYHVARGTTFADWDAAWRNWVRGRDRFNADQKPKAERASMASVVNRMMAERKIT